MLDVGAGGGFFPHYLAANLEGWSVTGMDNDAAVMAGYRAMKLEPPHSALEMHEGSMTDMVLADKDNSFDDVLAISVLHELDWEEKGISEMRRVLRPGGVLMSLSPLHTAHRAPQMRAITAWGALIIYSESSKNLDLRRCVLSLHLYQYSCLLVGSVRPESAPHQEIEEAYLSDGFCDT